MNSMTGFAVVEEVGDEREFHVEIRSVNNRFLEVSVNQPASLNALEGEIKKCIGTVARRGKVEVTVRIRQAEGHRQVRVDHELVKAARKALDEVRAAAGITEEPSLRDILQLEEVLRRDMEESLEEHYPRVMNAVESAVNMWNEVRRREGNATALDVERHLARLEGAAAVFDEAREETDRLIGETVVRKFRDVLGDSADEQRIYTEVAALMLRHATSEEVSRLQTHLTAFREVMTGSDPVGKRLDFICQEMNREINTTGSKSLLARVQEAVIEAKDAVEAIREQLRNIE